jgi:hypothetical protein
MWHTQSELRCLIQDDAASQNDPAAADAKTGRKVNRTTGPRQWPREPGHGLWLAAKVASRMTTATGPHGSRVILAFAV